MNTPSHIILHLGIRKYLEGKKILIPKSFVFWALAPDIGLYLCVILYIPISKYLLWNSTEYTFMHMFDDLYFEHPLWIFAYNILHAPLMLFSIFCIIYLFRNNLRKYYKIINWLIIWCFIHTVFDIPLHHNDGPRIFYPFSDYRFMSPISYWDVNYYANYVIPFELWWCILIMCYLLYKKNIK